MKNDTTKTAPDERAVLKPCPFCGGVRLSGARNETGSMVTVCDTCEAMGPSQVGTSIAAILAAWNTRTPPQVKPLVWEELGDKWKTVTCGRIQITQHGCAPNWDLSYAGSGYFDTLEQAKAAANAHHTRRILEALA